MNPLALSAQAVADATGKITVTLPAPSLGTWWQAAVVVPTAPTGATLALYLAGSKELSWIGPQPSASVVVLASQTVKVEGSGFTAGEAVSVNLRGGWASGQPQGIAPAGPSSFTANTVTGKVTAKITGPVSLAAGTSVDMAGPVTVEGSLTSVETITNDITVSGASVAPATVPTFTGRTVSAGSTVSLVLSKGGGATLVPAPPTGDSIELHDIAIQVSGTHPTGAVVSLSDTFPTGTVSHTVTVGTDPRRVAISGTNAVVCNYGSASVSIVDIATGTVSHTVTVGTDPLGVAISGTNAVVCNYGSASVSIVVLTAPTFAEWLLIGGQSFSFSFQGAVAPIGHPIYFAAYVTARVGAQLNYTVRT